MNFETGEEILQCEKLGSNEDQLKYIHSLLKTGWDFILQRCSAADQNI